MNPTAFTIFGIGVRWYAIFITSAMLLGVFLVTRRGKKEGFLEDHLLDVFLYALFPAIIGARAYYVLFHFSSYQGNILDMINIRQGGLAIHGGLIGAVLGGMIAVKKYKLNIRKTLDIYAPYVALGQSIGRWGNFVNQEAHGGPTDLPWGITVDGVKVHPTFLYESIWDFGLFLLLLFLRKKKEFDGKLIAVYMVVYSVGRFFIEGLRTDSLMLGSLRAAQIISVLFIVLGVFIWINGKPKGVTSTYIEKK